MQLLYLDVPAPPLLLLSVVWQQSGADPGGVEWVSSHPPMGYIVDANDWTCHPFTGKSKESKTVHTLSEFKGYGNTVGILAYYNVFCAGGGTSPSHAPLLNLVLLSHPRSKISGSATDNACCCSWWWSRSMGRHAQLFTYPVGRMAKTSFPPTKDLITPSCKSLGFLYPREREAKSAESLIFTSFSVCFAAISQPRPPNALAS